jgi:hypothetical protein
VASADGGVDAPGIEAGLSCLVVSVPHAH